MSIEDDSGGTPYCGSAEMQLAEAEQRRLIYGAIPTDELKRRNKDAFEVSLEVLFLQLIESERSAILWKDFANSLDWSDNKWKTYLAYTVLAHERSAEITERKIRKELQKLGIDDIDGQMMRLANLAFDAMPRELGSYLIANSSKIQQLLAEDTRKQ
ncbi:MAG: hypothetical protein WKF52_03515 [Sphingomicrobium sp.]